MAWDSNLIVYPFLFAAIYFESFLLVTLLSRPARERRERPAATETPSVAIIVPCWNEESTVAATAESLLALDYPKDKLSIVLVNDGSTDNTAQAMARFAGNPQVTLINKKNGGKHTALNAGITAAPDAALIGCLDADSFVEPDALREIVACFEKPNVMAATASMSVHQPKTFLQRMQYAEYIFGITMRHILSSVNGIYVTPGPFSLYRMQVFKELGGFMPGHQTEDMEMALRIQRAGYAIENAPRARVYTKAPATLPKLLKQRTRWTSGFLRNVIYDYRDMVANPRYGALGLLVLPFALFSMVGGVTLFLMSIYKLSERIAHTISVTQGIPLSYTLMPHSLTFNWFFFPTTMTLFLAGVTLSTMVTFIIVGKRISKTPGTLAINAAAYSLLYGFIAPLWLIRAITDVARGARRAWR